MKVRDCLKRSEVFSPFFSKAIVPGVLLGFLMASVYSFVFIYTYIFFYTKWLKVSQVP